MLLPDLLNPTPISHHEVLAQFQQRLDDLLATGKYKPFVYPYRAFGPYLLILYLLLPPTKSKTVYYARYPLFALIIYLSVDAIRVCRSSMVTVGYGIGLLNAWVILWSASLIIFDDARADFKRIEEQEIEAESSPNGDVNAMTTGTAKTIDETLRDRHVAGTAKQSPQRAKETSSSRLTTYTWQPLPPTLLHRLDWVLDLVSNFRGVRWTYQISNLAPPPPHIHRTLETPKSPPPTPASNLTRTDLIRRDVPRFLLCILALDAIKTITLQDPYFWSLPPSTPSPFPYPDVARLVLSLVSVYVSLLSIFLIAPLVFAILLGTETIGQHAWPWLYSPYYGPPSQIWEKGIAGLWAGWWHQLFRYAFEQAGEFIGRSMGWEKRTQRGMVLRVAVAFACSGILHACASYTTLGKTRPMWGSFTFFMLQPVGIIGQRVVSGWMKKIGLRDKLPAWMRQVGNFAVVVAWCWLTGPNIADDFAAAGIWLYEPIPLSLFRGLRGEGWWRWGGGWVRWYSADRWWRSGLAF